MSFDQPGIELFENIIREGTTQTETATPVFIGFTQKGQAEFLYFFDSFSGFVDSLGETFSGSEHSFFQGALYNTVRHFFNNGGQGCFVYSIGHYQEVENLTAGSFIEKLLNEKICKVIAAESRITLVAVPDLVLLDIIAIDDDGTLWSNAWSAVLSLCESRQGVFGILDSPVKLETTLKCAANFSNSVSSDRRAWLAAYWPRLMTNYKKNTDTRDTDESGAQSEVLWETVPACGAVAAKFGETDRNYGIWTAPANVTLSNVIKPSSRVTNTIGLFSDTGVSINVIKSFPGHGIRIWRCRTLADGTDHTWRYLQIRRLVSYIETSLNEVIRFAIFEPNSPITWMKLKGRISTWLRSLWMQGALSGINEKDAFRIHIGEGESMTTEDIKNGKIIIVLRLALLVPAEFIQINLQFHTGETSQNMSLVWSE